MKQFYFLSIILLLFSCSKEIDELTQEEHLIDSPLNLSFSIATGKLNVAMSRTSQDIEAINSLRILVFDENQNFLYSRKTILDKELDAPIENEAYLPDQNRNGIQKVRSIRANLLSSTKKRYLHLIANYNWEGFPQDYFIVGKSAGELISSMKNSNFAYWCSIEVDHITESTLKGKVFKLLRNYAKVSVESLDQNFKLKEFTVCNAAQEGSIAPFVYDNSNYQYKFPHKPLQPTEPANLTIEKIKEFSNLPIPLFERSNQSENPLFVIVKGRYKNANQDSYYKIDIKYINEKTGVTTLHNIIRNTHYKININSVLSEGYSSAEEAASHPASNNLFSSIEMLEYNSVSDGESVLSVDKLGDFITYPQQFKTSVFYTNGVKNIQGFAAWEANNTMMGNWEITPDPKNPQYGTITVNIKDIPTEGIKDFYLDIVAHPDLSSMSNIITRRLKFSLRKPYSFNASIRSEGIYYGDKVFIEFDIPKTMHQSVFPFDVHIETSTITPIPSKTMNMRIGLENGKQYYIYQVKSEDIGKKVVLNFIKNNSYDNETIILRSQYFEDANILLYPVG